MKFSKKWVWKFFLLLFLTVVPSTSENLLFFFGICTYSHRVGMWPLIEQLAEEGHNITILSSHPPKTLANPKIHEVVPQALVDFNRQHLQGSLLAKRLIDVSETQNLWHLFSDATVKAYESLAKDKSFLDWMERSHFDLIFMDALYSEFALGLAFKDDAPVIIFSTTVPYVWQTDSIGGASESWIPDMIFGFPELEMSFMERLVNVINPIRWHLKRKWNYLPKLEKILRKDLNLKNMPALEELERNISLSFINTHYSEEYARSNPPNVISIGGLQCFKPSKNKADYTNLEKFMNASKEFVLISLGSASKVSQMPDHLKKIFFATMNTLKTNFVLQWEGPVPNNLPTNVFPVDWLPQAQVLKHPNIKAFVTHGGMLGMQEAVCAGVPVVVIPVFAEQDYNGNRVQRRGGGIKLEWKTLTQSKLDDAILKLLRDPSYKRNMEKASRLFRDRPQSPIDLAVWWVNYILRHKRVEAIIPLGIRQNWFERRVLDVWLIIFMVLTVLLVTFIKVIMLLCGGMKRTRKSRLDRNKKQN